ncbi:nucleoside hydrolase [Qingshengfaniella alkalisoli]|uniref:Nucleoside hydrolase n=1 Tax=Qingshengfaniella alkalisoli TaxID=2599296 RepID=A0A5B8I965_9RHOB|nr:nucleoside hydrolase [Qingshengfaniella alkalisoli]QDY70745.1 nucleoside hydrolase [Qingshengfaniella alkalisoli]
MTRNVIIDTDPGIDDAIAILFALSVKGLTVRGITTVAGNIGLSNTTRNALRILALADRSDIAVYPGADKPLTRPGISEEKIHGTDGLGGVTFPDPQSAAQDGDAVTYLAAALNAAQERTLDILALGPLTNIARLIQTDPDAARRIGRLIAMGGAIDEPGNVGPRAEFNIANDPEAAEIVLQSGLPITLIPLDVTRQVRADRAYLDRLAALGTPKASTARALIEAYFASTTGGESRPLHDPCVPVFALRPDLFGCERTGLSVNTDEADRGALTRADSHPIDVTMTVDAPVALDLLARALG